MIVSEDESPYEIPDTWRWVRLGDISTYDENLKQIKSSHLNMEDWILELEDIEKNSYCISKRVLKKERNCLSNKYIFKKGNILYSKLRPYLKKILIADVDGFCTSEIIPFSARFKIDEKILFYFFISPFVDSYISNIMYGINLPRLSIENMKNLYFPLPPLEEQKEIVRILDEVLERENKISEILKMEEQINLLEKSILNKAFRGELGTGNMNDVPALEMLRESLLEK